MITLFCIGTAIAAAFSAYKQSMFLDTPNWPIMVVVAIFTTAIWAAIISLFI